MTRSPVFGSPLFLGFDHLEQMLARVQKSSDGYPPYNIEQTAADRLRITLAVAGFAMEDLQITQEDNQLVIRGRQKEDGAERVFLHRGIAARQFQRARHVAGIVGGAAHSLAGSRDRRSISSRNSSRSLKRR